MEQMDEILVLDEGRIVERGTHADLGKAQGLYRRMLDAQREVLVTVLEPSAISQNQRVDMLKC